MWCCRQEHQIEMEEAATRALALEAHMEAAQARLDPDTRKFGSAFGCRHL